jgi:ABC-type transport system involved in multi-copper enzyme maturation permease subunit
MKMLSIIINTLHESIKRITLLIYLGIATIVLLIIFFGISAEYVDGTLTMINLFGQEIPAGNGIENPIAILFVITIGGSLTGMMLFGMFATAGIIPSFLKRGTIDIYLSKPISRLHLLFSKYLGAVTVIGLALLYFFAGMFVIVGLKISVWNTDLFGAWLLSTVFFATIYAFGSFFAVISRSIGVVLLVVYLHMFIFSDIIVAYDKIPITFLQTNSAETVFTVLRYLLPQVQPMLAQITKIFELQLAPFGGDTGISLMPFVYSSLSGGLFFLLGYLTFRRTDY